MKIEFFFAFCTQIQNLLFGQPLLDKSTVPNFVAPFIKHNDIKLTFTFYTCVCFHFVFFHFSLKVFHPFSFSPKISVVELFVRLCYENVVNTHTKKKNFSHNPYNVPCLFISMSFCPPTGDFNQSLNQIEIV